MADAIIYIAKAANIPLVTRSGVATNIRNAANGATVLAKMQANKPYLTTGRVALLYAEFKGDTPIWVEVNFDGKKGWVGYHTKRVLSIGLFDSYFGNPQIVADQFTKPQRDKMALETLQAIAKSDQQLFPLLVAGYATAVRAAKAGRPIPKATQDKAIALVRRYNARQDMLKKSVETKEGAWESIRRNFGSFLAKAGFSGNQGVGAIPLLAIGIVAALVITGGVLAIGYFWGAKQKTLAECKTDIRETAEMQKLLAGQQLTPDEVNSLATKINEGYDAAASAGAREESDANKSEMNKYIGLAVGSILFLTVGLPALKNIGENVGKPKAA